MGYVIELYPKIEFELQRMNTRRSAAFKLDSFAGLLLMVLFLVGLFFFLQILFKILAWVSPILLVAAFVIDRSVVINYVKWIGKLFGQNPLVGIGAALLSVLGYAILGPFLFAKALFKKKVKNMTQQFEQQAGVSGSTRQNDEFVDFEEVSSETHQEKPLELPRIDQQPRTQKRDSEYDQFFDCPLQQDNQT